MVEFELRSDQDMISNLKADSQRLEHESRWGGQETMRDTRSHRPTVGSDPENTELIPRRMVSEDSRVGEDLHLIRQQAVTDYPRRHLFDHSERVHAIAVPHTVGPDRERSHSRIDRFMVRDTTGHGGSIFSQSSTYENPSTGSRATQWSSRSSYSTAPSSLQSMSDERGRFQGQEVIQYPVGRGSMSQYGGSFQDTPPAPQSYTDPRTGERVVISARRGATQRSATGPTMEPDDDPPDWDKTPNFGEFGRGP